MIHFQNISKYIWCCHNLPTNCKTIVRFKASNVCKTLLTVGATRQRFVACLSAGRDGIGAAAPLRVAQLQEFGERRLAAGTRLHQAGGERAWLARPTVAHLLAPVSFTIQHPEQKTGSGHRGRTLWTTPCHFHSIDTYLEQTFWQEKCPKPSNPSLSVPHRTVRGVMPQ